MSQVLSTDEVISAFHAASYDAREVWIEINKFLKEHENPYKGLTVTEYKRIALESVLEDLELLQNRLAEHIRGVFFVSSQDMGYRYGHYNSICYILFKWFTVDAPGAPYDMERQVKVPSWYLACVKLIKGTEDMEILSSREIIEEMLNIIREYKDASFTTQPFLRLRTPEQETL